MSFYTSVSGLKAAQKSLDVISHNIANSETAGFKRSRVDFADVIASSVTANPRTNVGLGVAVQAVTQNFSLGPMEQTGAALDIAIGGDGFFTTVSPTDGKALYTRKGAFELDPDGFVTDSSGNRLQVTAPGDDPATDPPVALQIPLTNAAGAGYAGVTITASGTITASYTDGSNDAIGTVVLAAFNSPQGLKAVGASNWLATGRSGTASYGAPDTGAVGGILSGSLERSNVDLSEELVNLITAQRDFQANAKAIDTATATSQAIINLRS